MGKGDKKSRRGKIIIGSFGVRRPQRKVKKITEQKPAEVKPAPVKPAAPKKPAKPVEEQLEIPVIIQDAPIPQEIPEVPAEVIKPAKKPAAKKHTIQAETEEPKPKVSKAKKKPGESPETKGETAES